MWLNAVYSFVFRDISIFSLKPFCNNIGSNFLCKQLRFLTRIVFVCIILFKEYMIKKERNTLIDKLKILSSIVEKQSATQDLIALQ